MIKSPVINSKVRQQSKLIIFCGSERIRTSNVYPVGTDLRSVATPPPSLHSHTIRYLYPDLDGTTVMFCGQYLYSDLTTATVRSWEPKR